MALIELNQIEKSYHLGEVEVHALRGLTLHVETGEFVALMGASGSGKTTLLNILGCLDHATGGSYVLDGRVIDATDHDRLAPLRSEMIGFVFQSFNLVPVLSASENIELPMLWHTHKRGAAARRDRALALLDAVGMKAHADRRPGALSGGQQQRVAVARALANEPRVVLADEPTANLDTSTADQVLDAMTSLWRREGVTFVLATHDPRILSRVTRVVYVVDGRVGLGPMHDPETGLFDRPYFDTRLAEELRRATRNQERCSLLALSARRAPPKDIADALRSALRASDTVARYQNDLYLVLLGGAGMDDAFTVADRVRGTQRALDEDAAVAVVTRGGDVDVERLLASTMTALDKARAEGGVYIEEDAGAAG